MIRNGTHKTLPLFFPLKVVICYFLLPLKVGIFNKYCHQGMGNIIPGILFPALLFKTYPFHKRNLKQKLYFFVRDDAQMLRL